MTERERERERERGLLFWLCFSVLRSRTLLPRANGKRDREERDLRIEEYKKGETERERDIVITRMYLVGCFNASPFSFISLSSILLLRFISKFPLQT